MTRCFLAVFLALCLAPSPVRSDESAAGLALSGFPAATSRCVVEGVRSVARAEVLFDSEGRAVQPIPGNVFIVAELALHFHAASSTISSKDFYLDGGRARFECAGFGMVREAGKPPVFVGGTGEATLSIGGEENFKRTQGRTGLTLVFTGPKDYAKGTLKVMSAYPVKAKTKTPGVKKAPGKKGAAKK